MQRVSDQLLLPKEHLAITATAWIPGSLPLGPLARDVIAPSAPCAAAFRPDADAWRCCGVV